MPAQPYNVSSSLEDRLKGRRVALDVFRGLPDDFQLYYQPSLRGKDAADHADPAIDYILAHKEKGLLGIVVKTGEIVEEPGGFISQYQPQKQVYKILDPVKPADLALRALFDAFDTEEASKVYPCGVAVVFPDTMSHEFSTPKSCYLFSEDLTAPDLKERLSELFLEAVDTGDMAKFRANFSRLGEFLKSHSDNAAMFEESQQRIKEAAVRKATPPVASQLRMKVAAAQGLPVPEEAKAPEPVAAQPAPVNMARQALKTRVEKAKPEKIDIPVIKTEEEKSLVAAALAPMEPEKSLAITKAEKAQVAIAVPMPARKRPVQATATSLRTAPVQASRQKDMFNWLEEVDEQGEGEAWLTTGQWLMAAGVAVAIICAVYFMARNWAIATNLG